MSTDLINAELLNDCSVSRLAEICFFNKDTSNQYIDYCSENKGFEFQFTYPIKTAFLSTLTQDDKEVFINMILDSESAMNDVYQDLCDCDYDLQEAA